MPAIGVSSIAFDGRALYRVIDDRRQAEGLSWKGVAEAIWAQSPVLNEQRPGSHPIAAPTIKRLDRTGESTCQHLLFFLRWVERSPEDFLTGPTVDVGDATLPACGPDRRLRWALKRTHGALDDARRGAGLTWAELARELGVQADPADGPEDRPLRDQLEGRAAHHPVARPAGR